MKLFVLSLEEDALDWFTEQDDDKFKTLQEIIDAFTERWGDKTEAQFLLANLHASQKRKMTLWKNLIENSMIWSKS